MLAGDDRQVPHEVLSDPLSANAIVDNDRDVGLFARGWLPSPFRDTDDAVIEERE